MRCNAKILFLNNKNQRTCPAVTRQTPPSDCHQRSYRKPPCLLCGFSSFPKSQAELHCLICVIVFRCFGLEVWVKHHALSMCLYGDCWTLHLLQSSGRGQEQPPFPYRDDSLCHYQAAPPGLEIQKITEWYFICKEKWSPLSLVQCGHFLPSDIWKRGFKSKWSYPALAPIEAGAKHLLTSVGQS